jgi:hypothetical protein
VSLKRIAENVVNSVNKMLRLLAEINNQLYESNRILQKDHEAIVQIAEDVGKIKINTRT